MGFVHPERLWALLLVVALVAAYVVMQVTRRSTYAVRFTNLALLDVVAPKRPGWRRHVTAGAFGLGAALLVVALAEPTREVQVPRERATVVLAIDVSLSMEATDILPSRLDAAKGAAGEFLDTVPETINVGLVAFAGSANVLVPPTTDHELVRRAVDDLVLGEGTGIGEAIFASLAAIESAPPADDPDEPVPATIVVLSDGETTMGRSNAEGIDAANEAGVPVSTIAFGTEDGLIFIEGEAIPVPPDLAAMEQIADATGGVSFEAESEQELEAAYADLGSSIGFETEERPVTEWFIGAAMVGLFGAAVLSLLWFARLP
jgi:Ca-activated chloride channel family protein